MVWKAQSEEQVGNALGGAVSGKASGKVGVPQTSPGSQPTKALIVVHGAGKFPESHVEEYAAAIKSLYGKPLATFVAYYADWEEQPGTLGVQDVAEGASEFHDEFYQQLMDRYNALPPSAKGDVTVMSDTGEPLGPNLIRILADEVTAYLFRQSVRNYIQGTVKAKLLAASQFDQVYVVAHSLGSVVAFDVLKQVADQYPVAKLISLGCPLGKLRWAHIRDDQLGKITEATVENWYNVYDTTDVIADAISPAFPQPGYRIYDIFVEVANTMPAAHDYMKNPETLRLIVRAME